MPSTPTGSENEMSDIEDATVDAANESHQEIPKTSEKPLPSSKGSEQEGNPKVNGSLSLNENPALVPPTESTDVFRNKYGLDLRVGDIVAIPKSSSNYDACRIERLLPKRKKIDVLYMRISADKSFKEPKTGKATEKFHMNSAIYKFGRAISEPENVMIRAKCAEYCNARK